MKTPTNETNDERAGWTSASAAEADRLCPGRHHAQRGLPDETKSAEADSGTRIHAALADPALLSGLTDDEADIYRKCRELETILVAQLFGDTRDVRSIREERLWLTIRALKHSGKPDVIWLTKDDAAIFDYKTGRNETTSSAHNLQLRDLAVMTAAHYGVKRVHVAILQPRATLSPAVCTYELDDLIDAWHELGARVAVANDPHASRIPGEAQCRYCRARQQCPEFLAGSLPVQTAAATPATVTAGIRALDGDRLGKFLSLVRLAEETALNEVRRRVETGEIVPGWTLQPGRALEKITDAQMVFNRALAAGIPQATFVAECITVGKSALKTALKTATDLKGRALDAKVDELLAGATETKTSQPILTQKG